MSATPAPGALVAAYPCSAAGVDMIRGHILASHEVRSAWLLTCDEHEMTEVYLQAVDTLRALQEQILPAIDRAVRDRWLSQGDNRFERAVRAHAREQQVTREALAEALRQCPATMPTAQWFKQQKQVEASFEDTERTLQALTTEMEAARDRYKAAHRELTDRLAVGITQPPPVVP